MYNEHWKGVQPLINFPYDESTLPRILLPIPEEYHEIRHCYLPGTQSNPHSLHILNSFLK